MSFLYPNVLWLLLALAIPVLVHLFNFRKPRQLLFSNLAFVKQVNLVVQRRMKLKQYLLLASRLLLFLALILLFAGPYLRNEHGEVSSGGQSVVIIVDNSLSMSALDDQGNYLEQARKLAYTLIQAHGPNAQYQVQTTGSLLLSAPFVQQGRALLQLDELNYRDKKVSLAEVLNNAPLYFGEATNPQHTIYFLTDAQHSTVMADSTKVRPLPPGLQVRIVPVGTRRQHNVYISDLSFEDAIIEKGKPVTLNLKVTNDGEEDVTDLGLNVQLEGRAVGVGSVTVGKGQTQQVQLNFTPQQRGWQSGYVSLEDLPIEFDNKRYFSFYIPENSRILLVTGAEDPKYLRLFFNRLMSEYRTEVIDQRSFANANLQDYSTVIMAGVEDMSSGLTGRLKEWVQEGGGIVIFPAKNMQPGFGQFMNNMGLGQYGKLNEYEKPIGLRAPDLQDQLFDGVFAKSKQDQEFDSPLFNKVYSFAPTAGSLYNVVLQDRNANPVLTKTQLEAGWVFTFSSYPSLQWSDFPIKSSFVPILYRATLLINNAARSEFAQTIGQYKLRKLKAADNGSTIKLVARDGGDAVVTEQYNQAGQTILKFDRSDLKAGNYNIVQGDSLLEKISFNLSPEESRLETADEGDLKERIDNLGLDDQVEVLKGNAAVLRKEVSLSLGGTPLWRYFLYLALLMVLAEVLIVRFMK